MVRKLKDSEEVEDLPTEDQDQDKDQDQDQDSGGTPLPKPSAATDDGGVGKPDGSGGGAGTNEKPTLEAALASIEEVRGELAATIAAVGKGDGRSIDVKAAVEDALLSKEHAEQHTRLGKIETKLRGERKPRGKLSEFFLGKRS